MKALTVKHWQNCSNKINEILNKNGVSVNSFQEQGEYSYKSFVITVKTKNENTIYNIRLDINKEFNNSSAFANLVSSSEEFKILEDDNYTMHDITKKTTTIDGLISPTAVIATISTLLFAIVACMVYALFRVKVAGGLTIVLSGVLSVLLTVAFLAITRIEINTYFFVCLGLIEFVSLMTTLEFLFAAKQKLKDPLLTDKTNEELANKVVHENFVKTILTYACCGVACVILGLIGVLSILKLALVSFVGLVVSLAVNLFVVPAFFAKASKKRDLVKPVYASNDVDKDAEVIEVETEDAAEENK